MGILLFLAFAVPGLLWFFLARKNLYARIAMTFEQSPDGTYVAADVNSSGRKAYQQLIGSLSMTDDG